MSDIVEVMQKQKQTKGRRNLYKAQSDAHKAELLGLDLERKVTGLKETIKQDRVQWENLEDVQRRCLGYIESCRDAQALPTVSGLSVFALGVSRQALNEYMRTHPFTETTQFLQQVKDIFADTLETAALNRNVDSVMSIFVMKNDHERADRVEIAPVIPTNPMGELQDPDEIARRLPPLDDEY